MKKFFKGLTLILIALFVSISFAGCGENYEHIFNNIKKEDLVSIKWGDIEKTDRVLLDQFYDEFNAYTFKSSIILLKSEIDDTMTVTVKYKVHRLFSTTEQTFDLVWERRVRESSILHTNVYSTYLFRTNLWKVSDVSKSVLTKYFV